MTARVEEAGDAPGLRVNSSDIRSLVVITGKTTQSQILSRSLAVVFAGYDVVNLERQFVVTLRHLAVLAHLLRALPDMLFKRKGHAADSRNFPGLLESFSGLGFHQRQRVADLFVNIEFDAFATGQRSFTGFFRQFTHTVQIRLRKVQG